MITTQQLIAKYGKPNQSGTYLVSIKLPYPMRLAWDTSVQVKTMRCHKLVADRFTAVFNDLLAHYGYDRIKELGIDLFGGCFNYRQMRGGSDWSRHAWGVAIDLDPARNQLKETAKTARFARPEYDEMHAIFEKHGFENQGKKLGFDFMHYQIKAL